MLCLNVALMWNYISRNWFQYVKCLPHIWHIYLYLVHPCLGVYLYLVLEIHKCTFDNVLIYLYTIIFIVSSIIYALVFQWQHRLWSRWSWGTWSLGPCFCRNIRCWVCNSSSSSLPSFFPCAFFLSYSELFSFINIHTSSTVLLRYSCYHLCFVCFPKARGWGEGFFLLILFSSILGGSLFISAIWMWFVVSFWQLLVHRTIH